MILSVVEFIVKYLTVDRIDYKAKWNTYFRDNKLLKLNAISVICDLLRWKN